jgi:hypothetical protein
MRVGDRVTAEIERFGGRLLGPSGSEPYSKFSRSGDIEMVVWAVENQRTLEVRHLREDRLTVNS